MKVPEIMRGWGEGVAGGVIEDVPIVLKIGTETEFGT